MGKVSSKENRQGAQGRTLGIHTLSEKKEKKTQA
jgi:hypothetical protein